MSRVTRRWIVPARLPELVVLGTILVAALFVVVRLPLTMRTFAHRASRFASLNYDDREFASGNSVIPNKQLLYEARGLIPRGGSFRVVVGPGPIANVQPLTREFASTFATYFLFPRLPSSRSRWVLCLGCSRAQLAGETSTVVWSDHAGSSVLRVAP